MPLPLEQRAARTSIPWPLAAWHCLGMAIGISYWAFFGTLLTLGSGPLRLFLPEKTSGNLGRRALHELFRWFLRLTRILGLIKADLRELDALRDTAPRILAPNHAALWDAVFIISRLRDLTCVMKPSILRNIWLGGGARLAEFIPGQPLTRMIRSSCGSLARGRHLLFFPEGTRTDPGARWINPLGGGCALIAARSGTPVQTLFIRTDSRFLQKGGSLFKRPAFPIHVHIERGPVLEIGKHESAHEFTARLEEVFEQNLSRPHPLRRQIVPPA